MNTRPAKLFSPRRRSVLFSAIVFAALAAQGHGAVEFQLVPRNGSNTNFRGVAVLQSMPNPESAAGPAATRQVPFSGDIIRVDEAPGTNWEFSINATGYWSAPSVVTFPPTGQMRYKAVNVWRTTTLVGRLRVVPKDVLPQSVTVSAESPPQPSRKPDITRGTQFKCELAEDGVFACAVPATKLDLVVRVEGFVPRYFSDVAPAAGQSFDLGDVKLEKGASVIAWLDSESAKLLKEPAQATLTRMIASESSQTTARLSIPVAQGTFNTRGVLQFHSMPAGTYILEVSAKGFAPARAFPIQVFAGSETALRKPLQLDRPITIRVTIQPARHPDGTPWIVEFRRLSDFSARYEAEPAFRRRVDGAGHVEVAEQAPGTYMATVSDGRIGVFSRRDFDLRSGHDEDVVIDVPLVSVHGKVVLGETPLRSQLWFGGRHGNVTIKMTTDENGSFEGALPHDGDWVVEVSSASPSITTFVDVHVDADDLIVRVPDQIVRGVVVDPDGGPLDRVEVTANAMGRVVAVRAKPDGTFLIGGLPEATIGLLASDLRTGRHSRATEVALKKDEETDGVTLRLEPNRAVQGRLVSRGAAVVGARLTAFALLETSGNPQVSAVSDETGSFELQLPEAAQRATVTVGAPGRTLQSYEIALSSAPLVLEVEPVGGTLLVTWPQGNLPVVMRAGVPFTVPDLVSWARGQGVQPMPQSIHVPNVAPGPYRACTAAPVRIPKNSETKLEVRCTEGTLPPGGTLTLDLGS